MNTLTPFVETPTGRITELVYLLSDKPLTLVHHAVLDAEAEAEDMRSAGGQPDPWAVVAQALIGLTTLSEPTLARRRRQRRPVCVKTQAVPVAAV